MLLMASKYTNFAITQEQLFYKSARFQIKKTRFYSRINIYFHLISIGGTDIAVTDRQTDRHKVTTVCSLRAHAHRGII